MKVYDRPRNFCWESDLQPDAHVPFEAASRKHRPKSFCISGSRPQTSAAKFLHLRQPTANIGRQVFASRAADRKHRPPSFDISGSNRKHRPPSFLHLGQPTANIGRKVFCISGSQPCMSASFFACRPNASHSGVSQNRGPEYSTLNSGDPYYKDPQIRYPPVFGNSHSGLRVFRYH